MIDWGTVTRHESVIGSGKDGEKAMNMYEVKGARATYRLDGDAHSDRLGSLDAAVGDLIVVCPFALPATALVDKRELPVGWRTPSPPVYAFAPSSSPPAIAGRFADLAPLHVPDALLRGLADKTAAVPTNRTLLVWAKPRSHDGATWDMGGWFLDASTLPAADAALLAAGRQVWLLVERPTGATLRGVAASKRLLD